MARKQEITFGTLTSMEDAGIMTEDMLPRDEDAPEGLSAQEGNVLWDYYKTGRIGNVPVAMEDLNLKIDRPDLLAAAFYLDRKPKSLMLYMSPDDADSQAAYDRLLDRQYDGEIIIVEELKQFDPSKCRFLVWVRYDELVYRLHPRYEYLRGNENDI